MKAKEEGRSFHSKPIAKAFWKGAHENDVRTVCFREDCFISKQCAMLCIAAGSMAASVSAPRVGGRLNIPDKMVRAPCNPYTEEPFPQCTLERARPLHDLLP